MPLGPEIQSRRMALGLTLREFARRVGVSAPFVTDLEAGRRNPSPEILARIASVLGVAEADLSRHDNRLPVEVRKWIESEPEVGRLLRTMQGSKRRQQMIRKLKDIVEGK